MKLFPQLSARDFTNGNSRSEIIRASVLANDNSRVWSGRGVGMILLVFVPFIVLQLFFYIT